MTYTEITDLINNNLASGTTIPASKHREVEQAILDYVQLNLSQSGDIKRVKCDLAYLTDNFEANGLGKNLRLGWAICNGNNGTDNLAGRVGIGYGLGYSTLGAIGGEAEHVLTVPEIPSHTHTVKAKLISAGGGGGTLPDPAGTSTITSAATGGGLAHNNMQPYIVNLYIMKL